MRPIMNDFAEVETCVEVGLSEEMLMKFEFGNILNKYWIWFILICV